MRISRIITHGGITLDLEKLKCLKVQTYTEAGKPNVLTFEFKTSNIEYIFNPETEEFEMQTFKEFSEVIYSSYDSACAHRDEWAEIWQDYLTEQEEKATNR